MRHGANYVLYSGNSQKNEYKLFKRKVNYGPCPELSSVSLHVPISSSFFLYLDLLVNYSIVTVIYSNFCLFVCLFIT